MKTYVKFAKLDSERQLAYGEVYLPNVPDSQGEFMIAFEIEKMAHDFLLNNRNEQIDTMHNLTENGCRVIESFITRKRDPDFVEGSWVVGIKCTDEIWGAY